jgi:hypothetical protein
MTVNRETIQKRILEDWSKSATREELDWIAENIPIEVNRNGTYGFNERCLGLGYMYSVTDYGLRQTQTDKEFIDHFKADLKKSYTQLCHLSQCVKRVPRIINGKPCAYLTESTYQLADKIIIFVSKYGYAPAAIVEKVTVA